MHRRLQLALRLGGLAAFVIFLCAGSVGVASRIEAADPYGGLSFDWDVGDGYMSHACVGKPVRGYFITGVQEPSDSPLAPLAPPEVTVKALPPAVGTLSRRSWTTKGELGARSFTYTPTKEGDEHLTFLAVIANSPYQAISREISFPVIHCQYRVSIHSDITNTQRGKGEIVTKISYDGEGHFDVSRNDKNGSWTIRGYGLTTYEAHVDGTESGMTCHTSSPGKGGSNFSIRGGGDPLSVLKLTLAFTDTGASVGLICQSGNESRVGTVRRTGWLPSGGSNGELKDLEFSAKGDNVDLGMSDFQDKRWTEGKFQGTMTITVVPETSQ